MNAAPISIVKPLEHKCETQVSGSSGRGLRWRRDLGQVLSDGLDHTAPPDPQAERDADPSEQQDGDRCLGLLLNRTVGVYEPQCYQWTNCVAEKVLQLVSFQKKKMCPRKSYFFTCVVPMVLDHRV